MTLNIITKTVQDVANSVRRQFGDESGVQISDSDIYRWVSDGQREIANKNKVLKSTASISSVASQAAYTLPEADILAIDSIHFNGIPLTSVPFPEVEAHIKSIPDSVLATGEPVSWYEWGGVVTFYPAPTTVGIITLLYSRMPAAVTTMADPLGLPDKYFNTLLRYCTAQAHEMDEDFDAANYKNRQVTDDLDSMADEERTSQQMVYPTINVVMDY